MAAGLGDPRRVHRHVQGKGPEGYREGLALLAEQLDSEPRRPRGRVLDERELDCLLVTNLVNVRYLTGYTGTNGACVVTRDERLFLTDFRYIEQARPQVPEFEQLEASRELLGDLAARLRAPARVRRRAREREGARGC